MYVVYERRVAMPSSCRASYCDIAVIEIDYYDYNRSWRWYEGREQNRPPSITSKMVRSIITDRGPFPTNGKTLKSGAGLARQQAIELAEKLNNAMPEALGELLLSYGSA